MTNVFCVYHDRCPDGSAAAWVVSKAITDREIEWYPDNYGRKPPLDKMTGKDVVIVDFSYLKEDMKSIAKVANSVLVLDHHKKAKDELTELLESGAIDGQFDSKRAGCLMAWDHYFPNELPPQLLLHVNDHDLWQFKLPETKAIVAAAVAKGFAINTWDEMLSSDVESLHSEGKVILQAKQQTMRAHIDAYMFKMKIKGHIVPVINAPFDWRSDIAEMMYLDNDVPFALVFSSKGGKFGLSFRSKEGEGVDVNEIAKNFNGGGHKHAAGGRIDSFSKLGLVIPKTPRTLKEKLYSALGMYK
ncbi:putative DHHA1 domain-containing protein [Vibrio chagasii]|nr:putative DHHA1 domain-containing protein [Vibrio chagasii]